MFSTSPPSTSHDTSRFWRYQCLIALVSLFLVITTGCSSGRESASYVVPEDIYEVDFRKVAFKPDTYEYSSSEIASGSELSRNDLQFIVNDDLTLRIGNEVDVTPWEFVTEYDYGANGVIKEYREVTGNYKVLVAEHENKNYLIAVLTLSRYMKLQRGIYNGMTEEAFEVLMGDRAFVTKESKKQESRIYTVDNYKLIVTFKDHVVRSLQIISGEY